MRDALPNACFIGFTGTPLELDDRNTRAVFGDYISIYDIQRAVEDGATVPIYYESRLAKLDLPEELKPRVDAEFEEVTEGMVTRWTGRRKPRRPSSSRRRCCPQNGRLHEQGFHDQGAPVGTSDSRTNHWSYDAALGFVPHSTQRSVVSQPRRTPHQLRLGTP